MFSFDDSDTICAISTPSGVGGIAVVRVSGSEAITIADKIWHGKPLHEARTHSAHLGDIIDPDIPGETLDTAVATVFHGPKSFTGENVVELSVHGSRWIQRELVNLLVRQGCRMAGPGEFSQRAFANGRLDLAQAEAVADVIAASSRSAHRLAVSQMRGDFSRNISDLRDKLIEIASLLELELDFSEEDVEFASRQHLHELALSLSNRIGKLADSFSTGSAIKDGVPVAIVGEPNVGKSTLLNTLLHDNRAIVSDIPGTTRDTIEDSIEIDGVLYRFIDTAGIRKTDDCIENLGIERSYAAIRKARIIIWLVTPDCQPTHYHALREEIKRHMSEDASLITVVNKIDTAISPTLNLETIYCDGIIKISASSGNNIETLTAALQHHSGTTLETEDCDMIVTNARHYEALFHAQESIKRVITGIETNLSGDFIAQDLRETIHHLSSITGEITTTGLLTSIFKNFCVGK